METPTPHAENHTRRLATPWARHGRNTIYIDEEINFYLTSLAKAAVYGTDASMTADQVASNLLRDKITRDYPELMEHYEEWCKAKQQAKKSYEAVEVKTIKALQPL